ncbi:MAG TPA: tRNA (adenosine(37)-N6)-dimethylallyltransferase MiaA [Candidatus Bathyarchaeia archaeon]|nr:tRNA (adenosine(37)-N6)-dimethylallyltransferase MiaA [Candidatus Bathyarchaeia archaeon]
MNKLLIVCGPTASGKTTLSLKLAKKFKAELISADSRQIYKGMDIISGKDKQFFGKIPVWGLDLVSPDQDFSAGHWVSFVQKNLKKIGKKGKLPIIVGGTGFWIKALINGIDSFGILPVWQFREKLSNLAIEQLRQKLRKLNPERLRKMNKSDRNNPRRLIRAIEIAFYLGKTSLTNKPNKFNQANYDILIIGLKAPNKYLYGKIDKRVDYRVKQGAQQEVEGLIKKGYSLKLPAMSAIGYQEWQPFFKTKQSLEETIQRWKYREHGYCRRQLTFFKKMENIKWFAINQTRWQEKVVKLVESWYYGKYTDDGKN